MPLSVQKLANRLSFRQLQVFKAVYNLRSYSQAGQQLGLTQPAVSSQMKQLEQALEQPLFEYVGRKLYCTAAGEMLSDSVDIIFEQLRLLQDDLIEMEGQVSGQLNLAVVNTAQCIVPYLIKGFTECNPRVHVHVHVVNRAQVIQRLNDNIDHLVIMGLVPQDKPLESFAFLDNELVPLVPAGHPLAEKEQVSAEEFLAQPLLLREPGSGTRLALENHCQQQRLKITPHMQIGSNEGIRHAILAGLGVAVLPRLSVLSDLKLGTLKTLNIPGFPLIRSWCLVYPSGKHPVPVMRAFIEYVQNNITTLDDFFREQVVAGIAHTNSN